MRARLLSLPGRDRRRKSADKAGPGTEDLVMSVTTFEIVSVNVGRPSVLLEWSTGDVISSIDKRPVSVVA